MAECTGRIIKYMPLLLALTWPLSAQAHPFHPGTAAGWLPGFMHPFSGLDHLLAMLAVGFLAGRSGGAWRWRIPALFLAAAGGAFLLQAGAGTSISLNAEAGIAGSLVFLGGMIALDMRMHTNRSTILVAMFGCFHGLAHGMETPPGIPLWTFMAGFLFATALLQAAGLLISHVTAGGRWMRLGGAGIATAGLLLGAAMF